MRLSSRRRFRPLRLLAWLLLALALLAAGLLANTFRQGSRQLAVPPAPPLAVDAQAVAQSLAAAVQARTVSGLLDPAGTAAAFAQLHTHLQTRYPRVHATLRRELVGGHSLLYTWPGREPQLPAVALLAHQDVVPVAPGTEALWQVPPFEGRIADGFVWGRGTLDDKVNLITQLEAVERLLAEGFTPRRTVILAFGHDEEVGGGQGAQAIVALLKARGVRLQWVLDEGGIIADGLVAGLKAPLATINVAEKGYMSLQLRAQAAPGHSSMPPTRPGDTAIGMLAAALARLEAQPLPGGIGGVSAELFATLAPEMPLAQRVPLSNLWLLQPVVERLLAQAPSTNAMLRSTVALTLFHAGNKDNVLPGEASATVNIRLRPGDSSAAVIEQLRQRLAEPRITIQALGTPLEASRVSSASDASYRLIERSVREVFPGVLAAPGLMVAGADARHYEPIAEGVYRFMPIRFTAEDLGRLHGTNERIALAQLPGLVHFYHRLLQQGAQ